MKSEQPEFKKEILNEIARCLNMPFNVAAGNSSGYNYAMQHARFLQRSRTGSRVLLKKCCVRGNRIAVSRIVRANARWLRYLALTCSAGSLTPDGLRAKRKPLPPVRLAGSPAPRNAARQIAAS
jgi:hypothetical protein